MTTATPGDDTAAGLYRKKSIALPGGKTVSPRSASANEIEEAATGGHRKAAFCRHFMLFAGGGRVPH